MKHFLPILLIAIVAAMCTSCKNSSTVNILISNRSNGDLSNVRVVVPMSEVKKHLDISPTDTLFVLNEKNMHVDFSFSPDSSQLVFSVPMIKQYSQKNFSINTSSSSLSDNLLHFRTSSIMVEIK